MLSVYILRFLVRVSFDEGVKVQDARPSTQGPSSVYQTGQAEKGPQKHRRGRMNEIVLYQNK